MKIVSSIKYLIPAIAAIFVIGCAPQPATPLYNYENYSNSYYAYKKNMSPESTLELQKSIEKIIENTGNSRSGRVPPGMYANLGYMYLKAGKPNEATASFTKEKSIYPESSLFMDRMINKIQVAEGGKK
jgi:hypothetical protein